MNALRLWTRCSAFRSVIRRPDERPFNSATQTNFVKYFTTSRKPLALESPVTQTTYFQPSALLSLRNAFSFHGTPAARSRIGWYKESLPTKRTPVNRRSGLSGGSSPYDPQPLNPLQRFRRRFDQMPSEYLVWGIIGLNVSVYFAWQYAFDRHHHGDPSLLKKMGRNVLNSWQNIREGRIWSIVACAFSHNTASHIFMNCFSFYFLAPPIMYLLGNTSFMALYFFGGITCSTFSLLLNKSVSQREGSAHGASGAIFAVMSFFACVSPHTKFLIFGLVPVPAWAVVTGYFVWDGLSTLTDRSKQKTMVDGAGHVGGIIAGVLYYLAKRRLPF